MRAPNGVLPELMARHLHQSPSARLVRTPRGRRRRILLSTLPFIALAAGLLWAVTSQRFLVTSVLVTGSARSDRSATEQILHHCLTGRSLFLLNAQALRRELRALPTIADARVHRRLPHTLLLHIREREPLAGVLSAGQRWLVDVNGFVIAPARQSDDYPLLSSSLLPTDPMRPGLRLSHKYLRRGLEGLACARRLPLPPLSGVEIDQHGGLTLVSKDNLRVRCGAPTRLEVKLRLAAAMLDSYEGQAVALLDVADPNVPFLRKEARLP